MIRHFDVFKGPKEWRDPLCKCWAELISEPTCLPFFTPPQVPPLIGVIGPADASWEPLGGGGGGGVVGGMEERIIVGPCKQKKHRNPKP